MRLNRTRTAAVAAALLGFAMGALVIGFSLFLMPASQAIRTPQVWAIAALTAVIVALAAKPFSPSTAKQPRF